MRPYLDDRDVRVYAGDCRQVMADLLPDASVDAVVTDPPYGLHFMGKTWDRFTGPIGADHTKTRERGGAMHAGEYDLSVAGMHRFQAWCASWTAEAFRVLKPGGHLLSFGGTRTYHRLTCALEDAGFEIRDCLMWLYGSGFPKSLDVAKAIDGLDAASADVVDALTFTRWLRSTGITRAQIQAATGTFMDSHYLSAKSQPQIPTAEHWAAIRPLIEVEVPAWVDELIGKPGNASAQLAAREVVGEREGRVLVYEPGERTGTPTTIRDTLPFTPEAASWHGWGTALKPAWEPVVVARKPPGGTLARNVLRYGTGALNIDDTRIPPRPGDEVTAGLSDPANSRGAVGTSDGWRRLTKAELNRRQVASLERANRLGRWPANVVLDEAAAAQLDAQTADLKQGVTVRRNLVDGAHGEHDIFDLARQSGPDTTYGDAGGASRFFYTAKASRSERNDGLDHLPALEGDRSAWNKRCRVCGDRFVDPSLGDEPHCLHGDWEWVPSRPARNHHPTVKPVDLMRWLIRLVCRPGGIVLDPFAGSGTTGIAARAEGMRCLLIEAEDDYLPIIAGRLSQLSLFAEAYR